MNKINKDLCVATLEYLDMSLEYEVKYNKNIVSRLYEQYNSVEIGEKFYCCCGIEKSCWCDYYGTKGGLSKDVVYNIMRHQLKRHSKYLYNTSKYGNRVYIKEIEDKYCRVFVYLRDLVGSDFEFVLSN